MTEVEDPVLRFLHLSDIHCTDRHGAGVFDLDSHLRHAICDDVETLRETLGAFTGILITGDIAFAATTDEYEKAAPWLEHLRDMVDAAPEHLYTVPGNHDVDRASAGEPAVAAFHRELRNCDLQDVDETLRRWLSDTNPSNELVYRPLENYNRFATRYGCEIKTGSLCWDANELPIGHGFTLSIRGLTSVFCSDEHDNDGSHRLVLGEAQALMPIERGRVNLSLSHHPPDWLKDRDKVAEALHAGTHVQLYGHKHRHYLMLSNDSLIVSAGATHPDRNGDWDPRFNVIELSVAMEDNAHVLLATVYPRVFNPRTRRFRPDYQDDGEMFKTFRIQLPPPRTISATPDSALPADHSTDDDTTLPVESTVYCNPDQVNLMNPLRRLGYLLVELPEHRLVQIATELELLEDSQAQPRVAQLIQAARDRNQLEGLWDVAAGFAHDTSPNPFLEG